MPSLSEHGDAPARAAKPPARIDRRAGLAAILLGLLAVAAAQRAAPIAGPPLYDGVVVIEPYRWLDPPAGQPGSPQPASATMRLEGGASPVAAVATPEQPPQAQIFGSPGALILPAGTTEIRVTITAIEPPALPAEGHIDGNVYAISVTNQAGAPVRALASAEVSVVLRGPADATTATIERWTGSSWQKLKTDPAGLAQTYLAVVTEFGDFAVVVPGAAPSPSPPVQASGSPSSSQSSSVAPGSPSPAAAGAAVPQAATPGGGISPLLLVSVALGVIGIVLLVLVALGLWRERRERLARERERRDRWGARRRTR